jgi:hypothetical protein
MREAANAKHKIRSALLLPCREGRSATAALDVGLAPSAPFSSAAPISGAGARAYVNTTRPPMKQTTSIATIEIIIMSAAQIRITMWSIELRRNIAKNDDLQPASQPPHSERIARYARDILLCANALQQ